MNMNRKEEIRNEAAERYKDSEYRVPNMYCFIQGAEWADANPLKGWNKFSDENMPEKGDIIALAIIDEKLNIASYELLKFDLTSIFPLRHPPFGAAFARSLTKAAGMENYLNAHI